MDKFRIRNAEYWEFLRSARQVRRQLTQAVMDQTGGKIVHGPLKGFQLTTGQTWGLDMPAQVFGLYEQQLFPVLTRNPGGVLLDIGAADGFWGVGLVATGHFDRSVCFEIRPEGRASIEKLAQENGVSDKVQIEGEATEDAICAAVSSTLAQGPTTVLVDIEGAEFSLLTPTFFDAAKGATIVVELHPWESTLDNPVSELMNRAGPAFASHCLSDSQRDMSGLLDSFQMHDTLRYLLVSEGRGLPQNWLVFEPATQE